MHLPRLTAAVVLAACLTPALVSAPDQGSMYRVILHKVQVGATDRNGKAWNLINGKPDIVVRLWNVSDSSVARFESERVVTTLQADFNAHETVLVKEGQELQIDVIDKGLVLEKAIGSTRFRVTHDMIKTGKLDLKFDQVEKLIIEFRKL